MRGWVRRVAVLALAVAGVGAAHAPPQPPDPVVALHAGLVRVFAAAGQPSQAAIEALAARLFDMPAITAQVLGAEAKSATASQRGRLAKALQARLARQLVLAGRQGPDDGFAVTQTRAIGGPDWLVTTREAPPGVRASAQAQPIVLVWRVRREGRGFRIVDSLRDGLSTVGVQHDDLAAALPGHTLDQVIGQIERRAAAPAPQL